MKCERWQSEEDTRRRRPVVAWPPATVCVVVSRVLGWWGEGGLFSQSFLLFSFFRFCPLWLLSSVCVLCCFGLSQSQISLRISQHESSGLLKTTFSPNKSTGCTLTQTDRVWDLQPVWLFFFKLLFFIHFLSSINMALLFTTVYFLIKWIPQQRWRLPHISDKHQRQKLWRSIPQRIQAKCSALRHGVLVLASALFHVQAILINCTWSQSKKKEKILTFKMKHFQNKIPH